MTNCMHLDASSRRGIMQAAVASVATLCDPCVCPRGTAWHILLLNWSLKTWPRAKAAQLRNSAVDQCRAACDLNCGCRVRGLDMTCLILPR